MLPFLDFRATLGWTVELSKIVLGRLVRPLRVAREGLLGGKGVCEIEGACVFDGGRVGKVGAVGVVVGRGIDKAGAAGMLDESLGF